MNCSVCYEHHNVSTSFFSVFPAGAGVLLAYGIPINQLDFSENGTFIPIYI